MHDDVLILPDGGRDFMRTLRLATLYADRVHIYSPTQEATIDQITRLVNGGLPDPDRALEAIKSIAVRFPKLRDELRNRPASLGEIAGAIASFREEHPAKQFLRLSVANRPELGLLEREGVLTSILEGAVSKFAARGDKWGADFITILKNADPKLMPQLEVPAVLKHDANTLAATSCTLFEFLLDYFVYIKSPNTAANQKMASLMTKPGVSLSYGVAVFFLVSSCYALQQSCVGVTWDSDVQEYFDKCSDGLYAGVPENNPIIAKRNRLRARLGKSILTDRIPDVSEMPIEDILEVRRERKNELKNFRDILGKIAAEIDPTLSELELSAAVDAKIHTEVKPALNELNAALDNLNNQRLRKLISFKDNLVTFAVSSLAGVPVDMPLQIGAFGVVAEMIREFTIGHAAERKRVLRSNPWSVMFHLKRSSRR